MINEYINPSFPLRDELLCECGYKFHSGKDGPDNAASFSASVGFVTIELFIDD